MRLLISLHDVAPYHLPRLARAEALVQDCGVAKVSYLLIPDYHGMGRSDLNADFVAWCQKPREFHVDWLLHGYHHSATRCPDQIRPTLRRRLAERLLTGGEGEFSRLTASAQRQRIEEGCRVFERCLGRRARGFVAPAWLFNDELMNVLREAGFDYTESQFRLFNPVDGSSVRSPVITWATRTTMRKRGSVTVAPLLAWVWSREPFLRIALHPFDFDHPEVVVSVRALLTKLLSTRQAFVGNSAFANSNLLELENFLTAQ